jgi:hypothetical protein
MTVFTTTATVAQAAGLRDPADGWLLGPGQAATLLGGTGLPPPGAGTWCAVTSGRLWNLPELPLTGVDGRVGVGRRWYVAGRWLRIGNGLFQADAVTVEAGRGGRRRLAVRATREHQDLGGQRTPSRHALHLVVGATVAGPGRSAVHLDLAVPLEEETEPDDRRLDPVARLSTATGPVAVVLAWDRRADGTPLLGAECMVSLGGRASVMMRVDGNSGAFGPGIAVAQGDLLVRTSHVMHPALGVTHRLQIAVGRWAGRGRP